MGIMCELFVADPEDAVLYGEPAEVLADEDLGDDEEPMETLLLGDFTALHFEILWALAEDRPWDPATHAFEAVGEQEEGHWLYRFPPVFVGQLATFDDEEIAALAARWARTEDVLCPKEQAEPIVSGLVDLARSAVASGRGLYLWGSL